jgi:hypothetical protein
VPAGKLRIWDDPWWQLWEEFRKHIVDLHYDELSTWARETGIPADRIFTAQGFIRPGSGRNPFAVTLASHGQNYDSSGVSVEGAIARDGHLGAVIYGEAARNDVPMEVPHTMFATFARMDEGWGVVEFNSADLKTPKVKPPYAWTYGSLRDMYNYSAREVSIMAWNGSNGIYEEHPDYLPYTAWRNTPNEDAMRDFLVSHADLPFGAKLWTFGTARPSLRRRLDDVARHAHRGQELARGRARPRRRRARLSRRPGDPREAHRPRPRARVDGPEAAVDRRARARRARPAVARDRPRVRRRARAAALARRLARRDRRAGQARARLRPRRRQRARRPRAPLSGAGRVPRRHPRPLGPDGHARRARQRRGNNLNLLRFCAASLVVLSHSYPLSGHLADEPLARATRIFDFASIAVIVFFAISGYLVARSYDRSRSLAAYARSRALRILPAYVAATLYAAFVVGPWADDASARRLPDRPAHVDLRARDAALRRHRPAARRVRRQPVPARDQRVAVDAVARGVLLRGARDRRGARRARASVARSRTRRRALRAGRAVAGLRGLDAARRRVPGTAARGHVRRRRARVRMARPHPAVAVDRARRARRGRGLLGTRVEVYAVYGAIVYATLVLAYHPSLDVPGFRRFGDYSYGIYVYAYPTQQAIASVLGPMPPLLLFGLAYPATFALAFASWHAIERPALALKRRKDVRLKPDPQPR